MLSVIIPTFNRAKLIAQTIESVLGQTYQDLEVIVVDDGSTDNTQEIVKGYCEKSKGKIVYLYQSNSGPSMARNHGMNRTNGEYIAFLDADDIWENSKCEEQIQYLEKHANIGIVACNFRYMDKAGKDLNVFNARDCYPNDGFNLCNLLRHCFLIPSSVLMRREVNDSVRGFNKNFDGAEDIEYFLRVLEKYELGVLNKVLLKYRTGHSSFSHGFNAYHVLEKVLDDFWEKRKSNANKGLRQAVIDSYSNLYIQHGSGLLWSGNVGEARVYLRKSLTYKKTFKAFWLYIKSFLKGTLMRVKCFQNLSKQ